MLINYLETARMWLSWVITKIDEVSPTLTYIGTWSYLSNWLADTAKNWWKVQRVQKVGTVQTIDRPMNATSTNYQEWGHIRDDRATLNRQ